VEIELGGAQVGKGIQSMPELPVREVLDLSRGLRAVSLGVKDVPGERIRDRQRCGASGLEGQVFERLRDHERSLAPFAHPVAAQAVEAADGEVDDENHRLGGRAVREKIERGGQARVRLLVATEELLKRRALDDELQPEVLLVVGGDGEAVEHRLTAVLEVADCRLRFGDRRQQRDSVFSRRSPGEQAERKLEPTGRTRGCSPSSGRPSFAQDGDGAQIAVPSGVL